MLIQHDAVKDAAVIGIVDQKWGEVDCAFILLKPGRSVEANNLTQHCSASTARYKILKQFLVVDALPRTASGKIRKDVLRELIQKPN